MQKSFLLIPYLFLFACLQVQQPDVPFASRDVENPFSPRNDTFIKLVLLDDEDNEKICSGTLIAPQKVLTAWHCFDEFTFSVSGEGADGKRYPMKSLTLHPEVKELSESEVVNDLAIVEFSQQIPSGAKVSINSIAVQAPGIGEEVVVFSFGGEKRGAFISKSFVVTKVGEQLFWAKGERALCFGDSGAGVFVRRGSAFEFVGVASSSTREECVPGDEGVFVNLTSPAARAFVEEQIYKTR